MYAAYKQKQLEREQQRQALRRGERPPKLPPRENLYGHDIPKVRPYFPSVVFYETLQCIII